MPETRSPRPVAALSPTEFAWIADFLYERTGIVLKEGKQALVMGRLERRLRKLGIGNYGEYFGLLAQSRSVEEQAIAIDLLTTNETYFFREHQHFDFLRRDVLPAQPRSRPLRVWSAACSTGEEAYSLAMLLEEERGKAPWEVLGSDISSRVLEVARSGLYPIAASEKIPPAWLKRHCLRGRDEFDGYFLIDEALRARVRFLAVNLIESLPDLGCFDVIFLRNVMIYFDQATKRELVRRLWKLLRPGGWFFTSHAESLNGLESPFCLVAPSIYRRGE